MSRCESTGEKILTESEKLDMDLVEDDLKCILDVKLQLDAFLGNIERMIKRGVLTQTNLASVYEAAIYMHENLDEILVKDYHRLLRQTDSLEFPAMLPPPFSNCK